MTGTENFPLQHIFDVADLKPEGNDVKVETTSQEREALAKFLDIPAIHQLTGVFHLSGNDSRVKIRGEVRAAIEQTCTVSLEQFDDSIFEEVEVVFADIESIRAEFGESVDLESELDAPDELIDGKIDLGALTAEFLALGLDPYPRKPGVKFSYDEGFEAPESPFAVLTGLKQTTQGNKE